MFKTALEIYEEQEQKKKTCFFTHGNLFEFKKTKIIVEVLCLDFDGPRYGVVERFQWYRNNTCRVLLMTWNKHRKRFLNSPLWMCPSCIRRCTITTCESLGMVSHGISPKGSQKINIIPE